MKTYPYHTPDGIIQLVEKRELDQLVERLAKAEELLREIRDDEVNAQDEADRFLRDHQPSELAKMRAANAELIERLAEARESHLAASARDVQTIQRQAIMLERFAKALGRCTFKDWFTSDDTGEVIVALDAGEVRSALAAYESANLEPANPVDVQTIQRQAIMLDRLAGALKEIAWIKETGQRDFSFTGDIAFAALSAYESANLEPVANPIDEANARLIAAAPELLEALEKCAAVIGAPQEGHWATDDEVNDAYDSAVAAIAKAKGEQP